MKSWGRCGLSAERILISLRTGRCCASSVPNVFHIQRKPSGVDAAANCRTLPARKRPRIFGNAFCAIDGVTVVSHEEGGSIGGRETIEAKVKFHPESDSLRAEKYIYQVLVPAINSSRHVPGVKVIEIVPRTLKRLDK